MSLLKKQQNNNKAEVKKDRRTDGGRIETNFNQNEQEKKTE